ncbi:MAG: hypothetical protein J6Y72_08510 [Bacteroidales bacterium]|nr:hypothetical protein [Bacteroidales bacterium]
MKSLPVIITSLLLACLAASCNLRDMRLRPILAEADTLLICNRDSEAYALLEPIRVGMFDVDDDTYALYCTLLLQAQDRCDVPLVDTLAISAWAYYKGNMTDAYHAGLAHYYTGKIARLNKDFNTAIYVQKQAQELFDAIGCDRYSFLARENEALAHMTRYSMRLSIDVFKDALRIAERMNNDTYISSTLVWLAQSYISIDMPDSAIVCLQDNRVMPSYRSYANLSFAYEKKREWNLALAYNDTIKTYYEKEQLNITPVLIDRADILVNMGDIVNCENILDTILPQDDYERLSITKSRLLSNIYNRNVEKQLQYFRQYDAAFDSLFIHENEMEVRNMERMLGEKRELATAHNELKNRVAYYIVAFVSMLAILLLIIVYIKWKSDKIKHENAELTARKAELLRQLLEETIKKQTIEQQLASIEEAQNEYSTRMAEEKILRRNICNHISEGLIKLKEKQTVENKCRFIIEQIDYIYPQLSLLLQNRYKELSIQDVLICSMTRVGFSANYIAEVLCKSVYTIRKRRSIVRDIIAQQEHNDDIQWGDIWTLLERQKRN